MTTNDKYQFKVGTDKDVNKMIQWWNDTLFENWNVTVYDVKCLCNIEPEYRDKKRVWSFQLNTDKFEMCVRRDNRHVESHWEINLPEPGYKEN